MQSRDIGIIGGLTLVIFVSMFIFLPSYGKRTLQIEQSLILTSKAFLNGQPIPTQYTCTGPDMSPPLAWNNIPENTKSFALICHDPDAPGGDWVHWIAFNIQPNITQLEAQVDEVALGIAQGINSFGEKGYGGPCPPVNKGRHHYIFTIYALSSMLNIKPKEINLRDKVVTGVSRKMLEKNMIGKILGIGTLIGTYERKE